MNVEKPHDIRQFSDGEPMPENYIPLSDAEFELLNDLSVEQRGAWLEANGTPTDAGKVILDLSKQIASTKQPESDFYRRAGIPREKPDKFKVHDSKRPPSNPFRPQGR